MKNVRELNAIKAYMNQLLLHWHNVSVVYFGEFDLYCLQPAILR